MPTSIRSPFDRPRWTESDARVVLAALQQSGKPVRVFAEEHGLDPQRLYLWRRRLAAVAGGDVTTFRELIVRPPSADSAASSNADAFVIVLGSGVVVRVPPSFDSAALTRLLEALTRAHAC
jgi:transposase-like protein